MQSQVESQWFNTFFFSKRKKKRKKPLHGWFLSPRNEQPEMRTRMWNAVPGDATWTFALWAWEVKSKRVRVTIDTESVLERADLQGWEINRARTKERISMDAGILRTCRKTDWKFCQSCLGEAEISVLGSSEASLHLGQTMVWVQTSE